ncbi:ubiquinol-cytochrome c reductase [Thalassotalea loyana]|uniref:Ubiquinol-cytochrome c reductase n=1 Tax=Thalassotalea loyana TaxID=280483 RepID=A0ABQ6HDG3_9GAMM|nr:AarF/ABC1/UbiB kinase family protein [Thalassotalea loyana]GLX86009.1 ubiquinol-cytochrome c reductase [Thalassotalea loyana]
MSGYKKVPTSRLSRLASVGGLLAKVTGNVIIDGTKKKLSGQSPTLNSLILQPKNIGNLADKLAELRGAAMKLGQLLSMDAGELLPPELSQLLEKLRSSGSAMPHSQLVNTIEEQWGKDWLDKLGYMELRPFAAASIGQVHLGYGLSGEKLAIKIQYPGVAKAIESDVDNVAVLLKLSGLIPPQIDMEPLLHEAKLQLKNEADYQLEASFSKRYQTKINAKYFVIPAVINELSTNTVLAMEHVEGIEIHHTIHHEEGVRNFIAERLIELFFDELFAFQLMQTDPNFANYLYQDSSGKIVLLDFGATREIPEKVSTGYRRLISACLHKDTKAMIQSAREIGFFNDAISEPYLNDILAIFQLATEPLVNDEPYDFAESNLAQRIKDQGLKINKQQNQWHTPPVDAIFIHRKLAGLYLLANKLKASVNVRELFEAYFISKENL